MAASLSVINDCMEKVEVLLKTTFTTHQIETNVNNMCLHVIKAGGKRLRPRLLLSCAHALPHYETERDEMNICHVAAAVELLHTATLVHDDVIDKATTRRGVTTLNETDGNHAAILAGDYLFTRCFDMMQRPRNFDIITEINATLSQLVIGELYQLEHEGDLNLSLDVYYKTIYAKTGVLFELACCAPAILVPDCEQYIEPLKTFGRKLGIAFQIKDDMLDYSASAQELGKNPGVDLDDQRITLPVLIALKQCEGKDYDEFLELIRAADLEGVKRYIAKTNALELCQIEAEKACDEAIEQLKVLPHTEFIDELASLCKKAVARNT